MRETIMYKVVRVEERTHSSKRSKSLVSVLTRNEAQVRYRVGRWATAPKFLSRYGYELLVFSTRKAAQYFARSMASRFVQIRVYRCACRGVSTPGDTCRDLNYFGIPTSHLDALRTAWPSNTRMAKRVKLLGRLRHTDKKSN